MIDLCSGCEAIRTACRGCQVRRRVHADDAVNARQLRRLRVALALRLDCFLTLLLKCVGERILVVDKLDGLDVFGSGRACFGSSLTFQRWFVLSLRDDFGR